MTCAAACALTSACAGYGLSKTTIDPSSPVAGDVAKMVKADAAFPKFSQIPPVPKDVRPAKSFGVAAAETVKVRDEIVAATEPSTWTLQAGGAATDAFASQARAAAGPELAPTDPAVTEAFAKELRRRATPPPPPKR
jgi:hypothetical protein